MNPSAAWLVSAGADSCCREPGAGRKGPPHSFPRRLSGVILVRIPLLRCRWVAGQGPLPLWVKMGFSIRRVHIVCPAPPPSWPLCMSETLIWVPPGVDTEGRFGSNCFIWEVSPGSAACTGRREETGREGSQDSGHSFESRYVQPPRARVLVGHSPTNSQGHEGCSWGCECTSTSSLSPAASGRGSRARSLGRHQRVPRYMGSIAAAPATFRQGKG